MALIDPNGVDIYISYSEASEADDLVMTTRHVDLIPDEVIANNLRNMSVSPLPSVKAEAEAYSGAAPKE